MAAASLAFRLSAQQERLWPQQLENGAWFQARAEVLVEGPLDEEALRQAVRSVVRQHEILRTVFQKQAGLKIPFQVIQEDAEHLRESGPVLAFSLERLDPDSRILRFSLPSLCADLRALRNLTASIGRAYEACLAGREETPEVLQYADMVQWQEELLTGEEAKGGREFWRERVKAIDFAQESSLLAGFENPTEAAFTPAMLRRELDLHATGKNEANFLLACWQAVLARNTGRASFTLGCELDGRKFEELEDAIGLFSRYLPIACTVDPLASFGVLAEKTAATMQHARDWQDSFSWSQLEVNPALPAGFDYAEFPAPEIYGGAKFTLRRQEVFSEAFELRLSLRRNAEKLVAEFHYDAARLSLDQTERWADQFATLAAAAQADPGTSTGCLPLLNERDRHRMLVEWNQTAAEYPRECVHTLFERQAERTPDRTALRFEENSLSYRDLNLQANRMAHALREAGVLPGALVGLCLERGIPAIVAVLAILKAGGAYVPLTPDHPKPRLAQQLAGAAALITEEHLLPRIPVFGGFILCPGRDQDALLRQAAENPDAAADPESLAYVIYTSGSTGVPKGVAVRHRNLVNYTTFIQRLLGGDGLHFAVVSTLSADLGNTCIYPSLLGGGCLHVIPYEIATDSDRLKAYMARHPVDVLKIVPSHLAALLDSGGGRGILPRAFLILGGETFTGRLLDSITTLQPDCRILNHYGPTETTVGSLTFMVDDWRDGRTVPIGKPISNTRVYILNSQNEPNPIGAAGELCVAGDGVTAGYLGQNEATALKFTTDPFTAKSRMYRTGDLARYLPDGNIEFLGRADDQIKIRGFRIELGDIEAALASHPAVKQAVVLLKPDGEGGKRLVAYVAAQDDAGLKEHLKEQLPEYMIPSAIVALPKLPLNANGKVDRNNLPEPSQIKSAAERHVDPVTPTETVVANIWAEVLRRPRVGLEDNFFEIGGHSLLATQVISRVRRSLEIDPPLRLIFESPTVRQLAAWIDRSRREGGNILLPPITPVPRGGALPLSFAQQRLWTIDRMDPNNPLYNISRTVRLKGELNTGAFHAALNEVIRRHESQRTTFRAEELEGVQVIAEPSALPLPLEDFSGLAEADREAAALEAAREEGRRPFNLAEGPLVRAKLLRLASDDHVFLLTAHHIVSDAWSAGIFIKELGILYEAFTQGKSSPLPELAIQYADYAAWQRQWLRGEALDTQLTYWRGQLTGAPPLLDLPLDRPRSKETSSQGAAEAVWTPADLADGLRALSRREDATLFMTLLAGFQTLLSRYSGQDQIVVGTDVANRTTTEAESLIGFFINVLALRTDLSGDPPFDALLKRVRTAALGAYAHQDMPFDKLVEHLQPERATTHNPLVQALFVLQNTPTARRELAGLELSSFPVPITRSKFDLAVFVAERPEGLLSYWVYRTGLFDRETILECSRHFEALLRSAVARPGARLSALEMESAEEKLRREEKRKGRKQSQRSRLLGLEPKSAR